jgi:hypothetical protein
MGKQGFTQHLTEWVPVTKMFLRAECGRCAMLTTLPPSASRLFRQFGILNISQTYRLPRIALLHNLPESRINGAVVRRQVSQIFWTDGSQLMVGFLALRPRRVLYPRKIPRTQVCCSWVNAIDKVQLKVLGRLKKGQCFRQESYPRPSSL